MGFTEEIQLLVGRSGEQVDGLIGLPTREAIKDKIGDKTTETVDAARLKAWLGEAPLPLDGTKLTTLETWLAGDGKSRLKKLRKAVGLTDEGEIDEPLRDAVNEKVRKKHGLPQNGVITGLVLALAGV